jgi:hypothetical protein
MLDVSDDEPTCYLAQERRKGVANMVARQIGWRRSGEGEFDQRALGGGSGTEQGREKKTAGCCGSGL